MGRIMGDGGGTGRDGEGEVGVNGNSRKDLGGGIGRRGGRWVGWEGWGGQGRIVRGALGELGGIGGYWED